MSDEENEYSETDNSSSEEISSEESSEESEGGHYLPMNLRKKMKKV